MNQFLATIDSGTTNTRVGLWNAEGVCLAETKREVGVRNTAIDGDNAKLKAAVKECLDELLQKTGAGFDAVAAVYASGMITSNVGLAEIPHLTAPAGTADFVAGVQAVSMPDIAPLPIHFVPGLKNLSDGVTLDTVESMDIMRGEETETIALLDQFPSGKPYLFVLPGSHTKFVAVDEQGRMTGCLTSLAGELLSMLTTQSILADAVQRSFVTEADYRRDLVIRGFRAARKTSLARAAFSTRIMNQFITKNPLECANFLLGAVLENDVAAVKGSDALRAPAEADVVIAGKEPLRSALAAVFEEDGFFARVRSVPPAKSLSGYGAYLVAKARGVFGPGA